MHPNSKLVGLNYSVEPWVREEIRKAADKGNCSLAEALTKMARHWQQTRPAFTKDPVEYDANSKTFIVLIDGCIMPLSRKPEKECFQKSAKFFEVDRDVTIGELSEWLDGLDGSKFVEIEGE